MLMLKTVTVLEAISKRRRTAAPLSARRGPPGSVPAETEGDKL